MNYAPEFTGVGRYTGEIGEYFALQGHQVCVVTTPPHYPGWVAADGYSAWRWQREIVKGVDVYRCPVFLDREMRGIKRFLAPLSYALTSAPVVLWQVLKRRPSVVIVVEPTLLAAPIALLAAKLVGAKATLHVQDLEVDAAFAVGHLKRRGSTSSIAAAFERFMIRSFDRIITISNRMAEKIVEKGVDPGRIEIIRNWVDLEAFTRRSPSRNYREMLGLTAKQFVVLYSGAIGAKQGVSLLIETARRLAENSDTVLVVAGEGPGKAELLAAAATLSNLKVAGFQPEASFAEFLQMADLHILPQERDAADLLLPSKLGGMLASGRPILVTAEAGTELSIFLGGCCVFTPPGDAGAAADAIRTLSQASIDPEATRGRLERAGQLSRESAIRRFYDAALFQPTG